MMRTSLLFFSLLLFGSVALADGQINKHASERNGWGSWADRVAGQGSKPQDSSHPVQTWLHSDQVPSRLLRKMGNHAETPLDYHGELGTLRRRHAQSTTLHLATSASMQPQLALNETESSAENEDKELIPVAYGDKMRMPADAFQHGVNEWMDENKDKIRETVHIFLWGGLFFLGATGVFIWSEVRLVMVVREIDQQITAGITEIDAALKEKKEALEQQRMYVGGGSVVAMAIFTFMICFSICLVATDLLASMGFAFEGCFSLVVVASIVITAIWCLFIAGLCWCCTRPWSALVCVLLSMLGHAAIGTEEPISVVVWCIFVGVFGYAWMRWGRYLVNEDPQPNPEKARLLPK